MEINLRSVFENALYLLALLNPASKIMFLASYPASSGRGKNFELSWKSSAAALVILLSVLGSLAIAFVVPPSQISLAAGADQAFSAVFSVFHMKWMTPVMCFLLAYGAVTMVVTWVLGPSKGVLEVAREGYLPKYWQHRNKEGMPTRILVIQGVISSLLALVVLFMPTISGAFWIMSALTAQLYMIM